MRNPRTATPATFAVDHPGSLGYPFPSEVSVKSLPFLVSAPTFITCLRRTARGQETHRFTCFIQLSFPGCKGLRTLLQFTALVIQQFSKAAFLSDLAP